MTILGGFTGMFAHNMHRLLSGSNAYVGLLQCELQNLKRNAAQNLTALYSLQTSSKFAGIAICLWLTMRSTSNPTLGKSVAQPA
jgi:hypothetical protein